MGEHPWMESEGTSQVGHLGPHGDKTLEDESVPTVLETSFPGADLRNCAGSLTGLAIPDLSIESSPGGF